VAQYQRYLGDRFFALSEHTANTKNVAALKYTCRFKKTQHASQEIGLTQAMIAFEESLAQICPFDQFICQVPTSANRSGRFAGQLGYFINMMVVKYDIKPDLPTQEKSRQVQASINQAKQFMRINHLDINDNNARYDYSSVLLNYVPTALPVASFEPGVAPGFSPYSFELFREIMVFCFDNKTEVGLTIIFNADVFSHQTIEQLAGNISGKINHQSCSNGT
jgi:hypothetical protein